MAQTIPKLKNSVLTVFQKLRRLEDTGTRGCRGSVPCCTCGVMKHWKEMDGGHFVPRGISSTAFDPRNVHAQCKGCNGFGHGEQARYLVFLEQEYGREVADELMNRRGQLRKYTRVELQEMKKEYKKRIKEHPLS